jgi:hypothetical protein
MINPNTPVNDDSYKDDPAYKAVMRSRAKIAERRKAEPGTSLSPAEAGGGTYGQHLMDTTVGPVGDVAKEAGRYFTDVAPGAIYSLTGAADEATGGYLSAAFNGVVGLMAKYDAAPVGRKFPKASEFADAAIDAQIQSRLEGPNVFLEMGGQAAKSSGFGMLDEEETRELFHDPDGVAREFGAVAGQGLTILMGPIGLATMTSSAIGNSVDGYYQYTKENDIEYDPMMGVGLGIAGGASEFVFNKISVIPVVRRFAFFGQEGIERQMKASVNKAFIKAVETGDPRVGARIIGTAFGGFASEAAEEAATEAVQTGMTALYRGIDASNGGVTMEEVLDAMKKGAIYGGLIGSVASTAGAKSKERQAAKVGAESRALVEAESATTAERQLLKDRLVASGLSESDARKMVNGIQSIRSERGARKKAEQAQSQVSEESDVQDILNSAMGRSDAPFASEFAVAEGVNRGELPSDADKDYILRGEAAESEEGDEGPPPSAKLFGRSALNAIAKRLVERFPKLAATIRDEGRITEADAALFLPEAEAADIDKKGLVDRISDQVGKAAKSSKEAEAERRLAEELQLMLDAGVDGEGNPLSEAAIEDIRQQIASAITASEAAPEPSGPSTESEAPIGPAPAPDASESTEDSAAAIAAMADGLGGIERLTDAAALDLAVQLGIEEDIDDRDQLNAAIKAKLSAAAETAGPGRMSEEEELAIEGRLEELENMDPSLMTQEQEDELIALIASSPRRSNEIDEMLLFVQDDEVLRDQLALLTQEYAETGDPAIAAQIRELLEYHDSLGAEILDDLDPTDYDEDGNPIEMMSRESEEEAESPVDEDIAEEAEEETEEEAEEAVEEDAGIGKLKANLREDGNDASADSVKIVSEEEAGPIARKAKDAMPFGETVVFYRGDANVSLGFYDRETGVRYVKVSTQETARVESDGRTKAAKKLLRRILLESYVQTMLHENIHARDIEGDGKPGTIAAVDKYLRTTHGSEENLDRLLAGIQGSAEGRNRDRELRAEQLTDREGMRRAGLVSMYDKDASIFQRTRDRLRRLMARRRGGTLENLIIRDFDAMSAEVTSSAVPTARVEGDAADTEMQTRGRHQPNADVRAVAASYAVNSNIDYDESNSREGVVAIDTVRARVIADMFDSAPDSFADPKMVESHKAMAREVIGQYKALRDAGYQMIPWGSHGQPYRNSREMQQDVRDNKRIYYYKTLGEEESFGSGQIEMEQLVEQNPLLRKAGGTVLDSEGVPHVQLVNDLFRAVHDIFGHAKEGHQFGPRGEENAWRQHVQMFTPAARAAMTSETRGQNSWVNYGPHLRREDGTLPELSDPDFVHPKDRPYSEQKIVKFPSWVTAEKGLDVEDWPGRPEIEYQERGKHLGGVGSKDAVVTEDLRDFVPADLRAGGVPLPYEPGQEPSLALGTVAHDRSLRGVRVIYPVGTFTQEDMEKIRDQAIEDMRSSSPLALESAGRAFVEEFKGDNSLTDVRMSDNASESFPIMDADMLNASFADESLREDKRFWYEASGDAIRSRTLFSGTNNIRKISDLLSATSPLTPVQDNFFRAYSIAADFEAKGYSLVSLPTPDLTRTAIAGEYERSNSYKASSFGDTMSFLAGEITDIPLSTNDIWVAYMFGMRKYNTKTGKIGGDNAAFNNPYAYLYTAIYNARLAEEVNRRIRESQEFAEASERAADRSATLADESLLTPWTPWQIQAYPWSHLSDSGTFDEAMDSAIGLLELNGSDSVITLDDGTKGIDLNVAATEEDFSKILQPSVEAKEAAAISLEVGGPTNDKGSERSFRRAIDAAIKADDARASLIGPRPQGDVGLTKSEREKLLTARYKVYESINRMLAFLAGNAQSGDVYYSRTQNAKFLTGAEATLTSSKTNGYMDGLYAALLSGPMTKATKDEMLKIARMRASGADPEMIDALEAQFAARSETTGVNPNSTAGFDTTRDTIVVGGQTPEFKVDEKTGEVTLPTKSGVKIFNSNWGLRKSGSGVGGYFEGVITPNLRLNMYGMDFEQQDVFMSLLGYALGEKSIGMSRALPPPADIESQELGERQVYSTVLTTAGIEVSADKLGRLNRYVEENPNGREFVFWNMQVTSTGTMITVVNDHVDPSIVEELESDLGIELGYVQTICETNLIQGDTAEDGNYNGEQILKEMVDADIKENSEWRRSLSAREAEEVGRLTSSGLRKALEARRSLRRSVGNIKGAVPRTLATAIGKSRAFRVNHAIQGIKSRNERFHREVAEAVESQREVVENIGIEFQRRDSDPTSPQFKAWFGNSVLKDADGMPAPFYHGTGSPEDFNVFDVKGREGATVYGAGAYFTDDPTTANSFAKYSYHGAEAGQRVIPAYIRIEKPFVFDRSDEKFLERIGARSRGGRSQTHLLKAFEDKHPDYDTSSIREILTSLISIDRYDPDNDADVVERQFNMAMQNAMRDVGHDGVVVMAPRPSRPNERYAIPFDPNQIKGIFNEKPTGRPEIDMQRRETIVLDRKIGMGAVPDQSGGSYFMTKMMTAKEFLAMVPPAEPDERTDAIEQKLRNGEPVSPPFLNVEWDEKNGYWEITGHEGRHRAQAMHRVEWGVKFPVDMFVRGNFNKYEQVETEDGRFRNQRRRPTQAELFAPVRPQRGSKKSKSGLVTVLPERAEDPRTLVLSREGRDQLAAEVPALVRSSLALAGDFQVEGKNGHLAVAAMVEGKLQVIGEYPYNANTNPGDIAIAAVERLIALDHMDSLSENIRSQIEDSRSPLQTFMNEEPTDADEVMLDYMKRDYSGIDKPIKSLGEEFASEGGIGIGHSARALGRFIRGHTIEMFQDEWYPITETIRRIEDVKGSRIAEKQDPMKLIRLAPGQSAEQARKFSTRTMNRIKKRMKSDGINNEQIGRFMAANHALERNARIREINSVRAGLRPEEIEKLNCGISDETANRLLEEHAADPKAAEIEEICVDFQEISFETAKIAKYAGLISDEDFTRITTRYKYYVPMNVTGSEDGNFITDPVDAAMDKIRRQKGSSGVGTVVDIATGRRDKLKYTLGRKESEVTVKAIVRGAAPALFVDRVMTQNEAITSRIANRLLRMAEKYPTPHISIVTTKDLEKRVLDPDSDKVVVKKMEPDPQTMIPVRIEETREIDGVLYERGETIYLKINDDLLIKKLDAGQDMSRGGAVIYLLFSPARIFTSMLRFTSTQWMSVDFTIRQPLLDGETALIAASEQGLMDPNRMRKQMMKRMPAVMKTIARSEWRARIRPDLEADVTEENEALGPLAKEWQEFRDVGAKQQWFNSLTVDKTVKEMERLSKSDAESNVREVASLMHRMFVESYSVLNDLGDNMWRFSYYVTLRENGMSAEEAGGMARNLTVDFSKKGSFGGPLSSVFAFFNATVQGNVRNYQQTMKGLYTGQGPARAVFGGLTAMGTLSAFAMMAIGGEDEDESGVPDYLEQIPEYERRRNIIIPWGRDENGKILYSKIPLQYGLEIPVNIGFGMVEVGYGIKNPLEVAGEVVNSYATAFNPVSGTPMNSMHGVMRALLPDFGDAAVDVIANRSWTGRPVYYGDQPLQTGGAVRSEIGSAGERYGIDWNSTAKLVNHLTGGDVAVRGAIDLQPQVWQYLAGTFGGSSLRNIERLAVLGIDLYKSAVFGDELPDPKGVPGLRKFIGKGPDNPYPTFYYEVRDRIRDAKLKMKAYEGDQPSMVRAVKDTVDGSTKMQAKAKSVESRLRKLKAKERQLADKIRSLPRGNERARASEQIGRLKDQIAETMKSLIKAYVDSGGDL